jgi:hypothetical protein
MSAFDPKRTSELLAEFRCPLRNWTPALFSAKSRQGWKAARKTSTIRRTTAIAMIAGPSMPAREAWRIAATIAKLPEATD